MTVYTAHQPDLLPYSGFFHKMAKADVFEVKIFDQIQGKPGYQRRVKMRDQWVTLPIIKSSSYAPINEVRIDPVMAKATLVSAITTLHQHAPLWSTHGPWLLDVVYTNVFDRLWEFNTHLISAVRDRLGITTTLLIPDSPPVGRGNVGIIDAMSRWDVPDPVYLSGTGARAYIGDAHEFTDRGIEVRWSNHLAITGNSVVDILMDYADPLNVVLAEHDPVTATGSETHQ